MNVGPSGFFWAIPWGVWLLLHAKKNGMRGIFLVVGTVTVCVPLYVSQAAFPALYFNGIGQHIRLVNGRISPLLACENKTGKNEYATIVGVVPHYDFEGAGNYYDYLVKFDNSSLTSRVDAPIANVRKQDCIDFSQVDQPILKKWSKIVSIGMYGPLLPWAVFVGLVSGFN